MRNQARIKKILGEKISDAYIKLDFLKKSDQKC